MRICSAIFKRFFICCFQFKVEFRSDDVCSGRKLEDIEKNPRSKARSNQQKTQHL